MNRKISLGRRRKTTVTEVPYGRRRFLAGMVVLMFCLSLFCSNALALYTYNSSGANNIYGYTSNQDIFLIGGLFGTATAKASGSVLMASMTATALVLSSSLPCSPPQHQ